RQFGFGLEIADGKTGVAVALARKKARYVAKIFALQRQRLVFRVALEEDELTAEILGEAVDAAPGRMRQQLVAVCRQVGGAQFVETRMRNLEGRGKALRQPVRISADAVIDAGALRFEPGALDTVQMQHRGMGGEARPDRRA